MISKLPREDVWIVVICWSLQVEMDISRLLESFFFVLLWCCCDDYDIFIEYFVFNKRIYSDHNYLKDESKMERSDLLIFKRIIMILNAKIVKSEIE